MQQSQAHRRLVKSPPELWAEVSSEDALARRLAQFGEIRITRLEPETTVAWEGDRASGTVQLEPSGWGTKVVLTATPAQEGADEAAPAPPPAARPEADPEPLPSPIATPARHAASAVPPAPQEPARGFFDRLFRRRPQAAAAPAPGAAPADPGPPALGPEPPPPAPDPAPTARAAAAPQLAAELGSERTAAILTDVLDGLGAAHHRPFSRD